jgi:hypothetical protein
LPLTPPPTPSLRRHYYFRCHIIAAILIRHASFRHYAA